MDKLAARRSLSIVALRGAALACALAVLVGCQWPSPSGGPSSPGIETGQAQTESTTGGANDKASPAEVVGGAWKLAGDTSIRGAEIYTQNCATCHGHNGEGAPGVFPALRNNALVTGEHAPLVVVPMYGRGAMPGFSSLLTDEDMALVLTYIRSAWGNDAAAISPSQLAPFRQDGIDVPLDPLLGGDA